MVYATKPASLRDAILASTYSGRGTRSPRPAPSRADDDRSRVRTAQLIDEVIIDGATHPDFAGTPIVELAGMNAGTNAAGLAVNPIPPASGGGSTVRALVINRFEGSASFRTSSKAATPSSAISSTLT